MKICFRRKLTKLLSLSQTAAKSQSQFLWQDHENGSFKRAHSCFWEYTTSLYKDHLLIKNEEISFHVKGDFQLPFVNNILLCFSLNSYCSCHWWFYLLMWLRVKEEIWIDWIYCTGTLIPVKFHSKVIAIGYRLANFSWFQIHPWKLKDFLLFGCNA